MLVKDRFNFRELVKEDVYAWASRVINADERLRPAELSRLRTGIEYHDIFLESSNLFPKYSGLFEELTRVINPRIFEYLFFKALNRSNDPQDRGLVRELVQGSMRFAAMYAYLESRGLNVGRRIQEDDNLVPLSLVNLKTPPLSAVLPPSAVGIRRFLGLPPVTFSPVTVLTPVVLRAV